MDLQSSQCSRSRFLAVVVVLVFQFYPWDLSLSALLLQSTTVDPIQQDSSRQSVGFLLASTSHGSRSER